MIATSCFQILYLTRWLSAAENRNKRVFLYLIELLIGSTTLSLRNVTRDDGGDYECVADNGVSPTDKHSMKLDVKCKKINSVRIYHH